VQSTPRKQGIFYLPYKAPSPSEEVDALHEVGIMYIRNLDCSEAKLKEQRFVKVRPSSHIKISLFSEHSWLIFERSKNQRVKCFT